jgi:hypothetical protein
MKGERMKTLDPADYRGLRLLITLAKRLTPEELAILDADPLAAKLADEFAPALPSSRAEGREAPPAGPQTQ